ncbi:Glycosyltransferase [Pseudomonas sp. 8Z]|uniref:DUF4124 domain-containing protein n=1 Tax=Pseudomonas sp. 8Z TaxID=2653166 RepID=UPI0012EF429F|nr:DUF4124 domain-containing protein [Pseudomonas sp. 8Z]VXD02278.1 Glycosyltransferase [Pseudomonas sp. 8Z]
MRHTILTGTLLLALSTSTIASQVYKWVDDKGVTHFGAQPPQGQDATTINTATPPPRSPPPPPAPKAPSDDAQQKAIDEKVKNQVARKEAERKKYCESARTNLAQLENNPRVRIEGDNGELRRIGEDERQQRITDLKKSIDETCR